MNWYAIASWVTLVLGLVPAAWFALSWGRRIRGQGALAAFDAGGWVYALLAVYGYQAMVYLALGVPEPSNVWVASARIALGLVLDAVIAARAVVWWRLRAKHRRRNPRQAGVSPGGLRRPRIRR